MPASNSSDITQCQLETSSECDCAHLLLGYYLSQSGVHVVGNVPRGLGK